MGDAWKFIIFEFLILCASTRATVTDDKSDVRSQIIVAKEGDNLTIPCNPELQNSQVLDKSEFEWMMYNEIPIYSNGRISPHLFVRYVKPPFEVVNSSLIYRQIFSSNFTFTCRLTRLHLNYTYVLHISPGSEIPSQNKIRITSPGAGETLTLPCFEKENTTTADFDYVWTVSKAGDGIEVISYNQEIILRNNTAGYRIIENGSLIIPNFKPSYKIDYICRLSNGSSTDHAFELKDKGDYAGESHTDIQRSIVVLQGSNVTLECPTAVRDLAWIRNGTDYLFISGSAVRTSRSYGLEMHSDGKSLIITDFSSSLIGTYECRSRTGLKYTYDVKKQNPVDLTIVAKLGEEIVLPCSTKSDEPEDSSSFVWTRNNAELLFVNEYPVAGSNNYKFKISDDLRSLVITEFLISLMGIYTCRLSSGMNFTYHVTIPIPKESMLKKETLIVPYGTRYIVLPCPATNNTVKWINNTILVNPEEDVVLPCPLTDPRDRDINSINWAVHFQNEKQSKYNGDFSFIEGNPLDNLVLENPKFADGDGGKSLVFSNITSDMEGEFQCFVVVSNTMYRYEVKVRDS